MVRKIYEKAFGVLMQKPFRLWGISLLSGLLTFIAGIAFGPIIACTFVATTLLGVGMQMIYLNTYRTELQPKAAFLFAAFKKEKILKVAGGMAWSALWIFLWGLIPVVGVIFAIIRAYEYRFVPYILMTRDDVSATDAIKVSKEETMGYKGKMFGADILVYALFAAAMIVLGLLGKIPVVGVLFAIICVLLAIVFVLLVPLFLGLVQAAFYVEIKSAQTAEAVAEAPAEPEAPAE